MFSKSPSWLATSLCFLCAALHIPSAAAQDLSLSTGIDASSGTYGSSQSTSIIYVPITLKYEEPFWNIKLTLPYIRMISQNAVLPDQTASGPGDIIAAGTRNLYQDLSQGFTIDLTGKVKIPTADATQRLGTGKYDYSAQLDILKQRGTYMVFGNIGYRQMGDPDGINFNNPWFGSLGAGHNASSTTQWGGIYEIQQPILDGNSPIKDIMIYITHKITPTYSVQGYIAKGLSDSSPDWGSGLSLSTRF